MVDDIGVSESNRKYFKASVNGVIAAANGAVRMSGNYAVEKVTAACIQRLHGREEYEGLILHPDLETFIAKKAHSLVDGYGRPFG